ncbi:hypothetical protein AB0O34_20200 [Sphaerisporangium sp. NPDC088356]|uniref:hypothetical protein n=1 Tax=Sphaerisporangium sp. NPDC088356 TaxID=3154871 RepID=UPI003420ADCD
MTDLSAWSERIIHGPGGLTAYLDHDASTLPDPQTGAVEWALRCLANPASQGYAEVLAAIIARRADLSCPTCGAHYVCPCGNVAACRSVYCATCAGSEGAA